jgi:translation initiation factor eIF-2B subunit delta
MKELSMETTSAEGKPERQGRPRGISSAQHPQVTVPVNSSSHASSPSVSVASSTASPAPASSAAALATAVPAHKAFVSHLAVQKKKKASHTGSVSLSVDEPIHPSFVRLGLMYAERRIIGSTARATALIVALQHFIRDYTTPEKKELSRDLVARLTPQIDYVNACRPKSISMGSVLMYLKACLTLIDPSMTEAAAKEFLLEKLDQFLERRITFAHEAMARIACEKMSSDDVVLTFARSHVVETILTRLRPRKVIVLDSEPYFEGRQMLRALSAQNIPCAYASVAAASHMMRGVTKVILGAHALMHNGAMLSRAGAATVALVARSYNVPILVACETFKFSEKAPLDALAVNELGDPDEIAVGHDVLNLVYDLTPVEFIDMVLTEVGCIPPTSVPVVLRESKKDQLSW